MIFWLYSFFVTVCIQGQSATNLVGEKETSYRRQTIFTVAYLRKQQQYTQVYLCVYKILHQVNGVCKVQTAVTSEQGMDNSH